LFLSNLFTIEIYLQLNITN